MTGNFETKIKLMKTAQERLENMAYRSQDLSGRYRERLAVYVDLGLDDNAIFATEIGFLWEFIDKGLGSAVGWAGVLDELLKQKEQQ